MISPYYLPYNRWTPRMLSKQFPVHRLNRNGEAILRTLSVTADTEASTVTYGICPWKWRQLCDEGILYLRVANTPPAGSEAFLVSISTSPSDAVTPTTIPLINGSGDQVTSAEIIAGNVYQVYYNKCEGIMQLVNYIPAATA